MTAYQVFCKEYRVNINAEQPGLGECCCSVHTCQSSVLFHDWLNFVLFPASVFGELSKKLAEVWKQLPEKDKLVNTFYLRFWISDKQ